MEVDGVRPEHLASMLGEISSETSNSTRRTEKTSAQLR
jgi:hypothetical protein